VVLVDVQAPLVVAHDLAEAATELDSRRVVAAGEAASGSAWAQPCQVAAVEPRAVVAPPRAAELAAAPLVALWWARTVVQGSRTMRPSCTPADARIASSRR